MINKIFGTFGCAVLGVVVGGTIGYYAAHSPVVGGLIGAVAGAAVYWLTGQGSSLNDKQGR